MCAEGYKYGYGYGPDDSDPSYYATIMAFGGKKVPMYSTPDYSEFLFSFDDT